jgi:hypothetical protein
MKDSELIQKDEATLIRKAEEERDSVQRKFFPKILQGNAFIFPCVGGYRFPGLFTSIYTGSKFQRFLLRARAVCSVPTVDIIPSASVRSSTMITPSEYMSVRLSTGSRVTLKRRRSKEKPKAG